MNPTNRARDDGSADGCSEYELPVSVSRDTGPGRQRLPGVSSATRLALAALVLVLVCGLAVGLRLLTPPRSPRMSASPDASDSAVAMSSGLALRTPGSTVQTETAHLDEWGLAFDYPAGWYVAHPADNMHVMSVLAFLGTGSGYQVCTPWGDTVQCYSDIHLESDQVIVRLSELTTQVGGPFDAADAKWLNPGQDLVTVGGLPATYSESTRTGWYESDLALVWNLSAPGSILERYEIDAYMRGPDVDVLRTEVDRLVASIRYDPAPVKLDPTQGPGVASGTLAELKAAYPDSICYPTALGATSQELQLVFGVQLTKPLPVTCTAQIEPYVGLWKLTITTAWNAAPDRSAGSYTLQLYLTPSGERTWSEAIGGPVPYWPSS